MEGFDDNQMTKRKPAIWGPPETAIDKKGFIVDFLESICWRVCKKEGYIVHNLPWLVSFLHLILLLGQRWGEWERKCREGMKY